MIEELSININKQVIVTLINGTEKYGTLTSIDVENKVIRLRDDNNNAVSILFSMIGVVESKKTENEPGTPFVKEITKAASENNGEVIDGNNQELFRRTIEIEARFDVGIKNATLNTIPPDFIKPREIKSLNQGTIESQESKSFGRIEQIYNRSASSGRFVPTDEEIRLMIDKCDIILRTQPQLGIIYGYSGYFNYLKNNKTGALESYRKAAITSGQPHDWLNLAAIAHEQGEDELTCYSLGQLFLEASCAESDYEKAWYKFIELVIKFAAYDTLSSIVNNSSKQFSPEENLMFFDSICYCLLKSELNKLVTELIQTNRNGNDKASISECLQHLPKQPSQSYISFKRDFESTAETLKASLAHRFNIVKSITVSRPVTSNTNSEPVRKESALKRLERNIPERPVRNANSNLLKKARIERDFKNYIRAEELFRQAIEIEYDLNIKKRAVRDLANMLAQLMNEPKKAIEVIHKYQTTLSEPDLNVLYEFNVQLGEYQEAIRLQTQILKTTHRKELQIARYSNIAACYFKLENYLEAERNYRSALDNNPSNYTIQRNLALCLYHQGKTDEAREMLNAIADYGDLKAKELLDGIEGRNQNIDIIIDTTGLVFENLDTFTNFYLADCEFKHIDKSRISNDKKYIGTYENKSSDLYMLEETARKYLNSKLPEERSNAYLSAARILFDLNELNNDFYKYLGRSLTSRGDNAVRSNNSLDTVKSFYLTALKIYDALYLDEQKASREEQDGVNALCRYLYSHLGRDKIPMTMSGDRNLSVRDTIKYILLNSPEKSKVFDALSVLFARSPQYSIDRVLRTIYEDKSLLELSNTYLKAKSGITYQDFVDKWNARAREIFKQESELSAQLSPLRNFQMTETWLLSGIERIKASTETVLFDSDKSDYLTDLQNLFDNCISLCKTTDIDEKNNRHDDVKFRAENLQVKIRKNPTKLSIEEIYPIVTNALLNLEKYVRDLNEASKPKLFVSSAFNTYQVKTNNLLDIQIKIENDAEGHAEQVELLIENDANYYQLAHNQAISYGTIRGKGQQIEILTLSLTDKAITEQAFPLRTIVKFRTRHGEQNEGIWQETAIQLGNPEDFVPAENKYATYAESAEVKDEDMFYGRDKIVDDIYDVVCNQYKSFVFYGQKRAGKSSILYHLEQKLSLNSSILAANIGNIGGLIDEKSETPLLYQILFVILQQINFEIEDKEFQGLTPLQIEIPSDLDFYRHPSPLQLFKTTFQDIKRKMSRVEGWQQMRIVVLIDEFTYIYHLIVTKRLSADFMLNWKALLQENYFSVVLVAQDFYPKFKALDHNAFQTMQSQRVSYLESRYAEELIDVPIKLNNNSRYTPEGIKRVLELTAGSPFYIQIFCDKLVEYINSDKVMKITEANVNKLLKDKMMNLDKGVFDNLINDGDTSADAISREDSEAVLREVAKHTKNREWCNKNQFACTTRKHLDEILGNLVQREVVETNRDGFYRLHIGLFKEWLNENPI